MRDLLGEGIRHLRGEGALAGGGVEDGVVQHGLGGVLVELLRELTDSYQMATILVTHDRSLCQYADRELRLKDGALLPVAAA
ncbi:hypothetical protein L1O03_09170 [Corynebacterium uropygiale]|uniref:ABC transporter ATP-binding protein n=1 Tax=Corynebacterium uropygiale TaxID=1775911 RepID=A0A9X1TZW1_9CORY|nr:hypothetical protein [Corynebacterium uropygiale]MCF4007341.1 hypothetical protein [Corynebacterium uropygiale]